ncbi:MAG TPA: PepSY domain-containing protein [Cellvibrio sp.]|jgi:uncharacterized membrane protein YkoI|uniref:Peptidase n=1 Tax=Cellvibrio mixtus TaxID=39650 RepID=A0A266QBW7_9GAMM|nr:PepSY domain-containing protein [Cellvibrio mixtus]OZY87362.1 peptidase [Cellvibrio mixtus]
MRPLLRFISYIPLLALTLSVNADDLSQDEALRLRELGRIMPLENLLSIVQARHPASRLLEVELEEDDDIYIYEVELITRDGTVRELEIDASTGQLLKDEEDD